MTTQDEANAGLFFGIQVALRALAIRHPDPDRFLLALHEEREGMLALLLARATPERTIDAYRDCLDALVPQEDGASGVRPPQA